MYQIIKYTFLQSGSDNSKQYCTRNGGHCDKRPVAVAPYISPGKSKEHLLVVLVSHWLNPLQNYKNTGAKNLLEQSKRKNRFAIFAF
jgi:hypothetical protein